MTSDHCHKSLNSSKPRTGATQLFSTSQAFNYTYHCTLLAEQPTRLLNIYWSVLWARKKKASTSSVLVILPDSFLPDQPRKGGLLNIHFLHLLSLLDVYVFCDLIIGQFSKFPGWWSGRVELIVNISQFMGQMNCPDRSGDKISGLVWLKWRFTAQNCAHCTVCSIIF